MNGGGRGKPLSLAALLRGLGDGGRLPARLRQLRSAGSLADNARQPTNVQAGLLLGHDQFVTACAAMNAVTFARACYRDVVSPILSRCVGPAAFLVQKSEAVHAVDQHIRPALQLQLVGPILMSVTLNQSRSQVFPSSLMPSLDFLVAAGAR